MDVSAERLRSDDIIIAVMGPTGTGKSNFIEILTGQRGRSSDKLESYTNQVQSTLLKDYEDGRNLVLVDTPGFDNTYKSDMDILEMIAEWLAKTYRRNIKLTGILYLHRITDNRMGGSPPKNLRMFGELCGDLAMRRVTLVTTMWDKMRDLELGQQREKELRDTFWKDMLSKGSTIAKFNNEFDTAKEIVHGLIVEKEKREALLLQEELVDLKWRLNETHAGRMLYDNLQHLLDEQKASIEKLVAQIDGQTNRYNHNLLERLRKEQRRMEEDLERTLDSIQKLKIPLSRRIVLFLFGRKGKTPPQFQVQVQLRSRISKLVENVDRRVKVTKLVGNDAQLVADYLNDVLHEANILKSKKGKCLLDLLCELVKSAKVYPQCYTLRKGVQREPQPVGGGGFADVYKGTYKGRAICLKVCRIFQRQGHVDFLRTHMKEIIVWAHLSHSNILPFYGVYLDDELQRICLLSPWMENGNLREYLEKHPLTPWPPLVSDIVEGLQYLHGLDIIHGDLKAENVLLSDAGRALITDFGVSYIAMNTADKLRSATFLGGTVRWNAPELLSGGDVPVRPTTMSDIWSFGCLCYEVLTRRVPFYQYERDYQVINALQNRQEAPIRLPTGDASSTADDRIWRLMVDCWNYEPQNRPTCKAIRESIVGLESQDNRPMLSPRDEDNLDFWKEMRAKSDVKIDYERVAQLLLDLSTETS